MESSSTSSVASGLLGFPFKGGTHFFHPEQIIRLEAESNYTFIYVREQKPIIMAKVLANYETLLAPFGFLRTHRSHLINKQHVLLINEEGRIVMDDQSVADLSRRKRKHILKILSTRQAA
ncbi:MAG TPA: LytTR family DNA-binding domain-containing protein [Saprospiraceae bacterium]|nr:LytTR family DNA-binding domain-containing protein [Saprospiraceae bacterium]